MSNSNILETKDLRIELECGANGCVVTLHSPQTFQAPRRVPLLAMEIYDRTVLRVERFTHHLVETPQRVGDALHVTVREPKCGIVFSLTISITGAGELSVVMNPADLRENRVELYRLFSIDLLPGLMASETAAELLLPLNTGVVVRTMDKPRCTDRFLIYGEQARWELLPTLPVCAIQTAAGGMVALAAQGAAETECRVTTDGQGGSVGFAFFMRGDEIDPIEISPREIRYTPIPVGRDVTVFTAGVVRTHVMRDLGKQTLEQRAKESPEVKYLLGAYIMKLFYGVQAQGAMLNADGAQDGSRFILTMTFDEAKQGLKRFQDAGVDKIYTQNVGWNLRGHDGAYPTRFPIEPRVGGEAKFRELIQYGHDLGYLMTVHDNYLDGYEISEDFDPEVVTVDRYGQMQIRGFWGGGPSYLMWPMAYEDKHLADEMRRVKALGIRGPYYLDGMGSPLYINHHPRHLGSRTQLAKGIDRLLTTARDLFGCAATETGFLYCSITPDLVANPGNDHLLGLSLKTWPITALLDRCVPLWNLVMSGLVVTENQGLGWTDTMRALLYNQQPRHEWSTRPGVQPVLDDSSIEKIKFRYDLLIKKYGYLRTQQMTTFSRDGSIESTTFEDGTSVRADFATGELWVNDERIANPAAGRSLTGRTDPSRVVAVG